MKKILSIFAILAICFSVFFFTSCAQDEIEVENTNTGDVGSVKLSFAIPRFMVPDVSENSRMVMPSTAVIKFIIEEKNYSSEFYVANSSEVYEDYSMVTAELDDVPVGIYSADTVKVELYDSNVDSILTYATNDSAFEVKAGGEPETVSFYCLPENVSEVEFEGNETTAKGPIVVDEESFNSYDIFFEVYKVTPSDGCGMKVKLNAKNIGRKEVALACYTEDGVASELPILVKKDSEFNGTEFLEISSGYVDYYYIVLYTKGVLTALSGEDEPYVEFVLTDD